MIYYDYLQLNTATIATLVSAFLVVAILLLSFRVIVRVFWS